MQEVTIQLAIEHTLHRLGNIEAISLLSRIVIPIDVQPN